MASWAFYNSFKKELLAGNHDLDGGTYKLMLTTATHTPAATHTTRSDITNEVSGTNYTPGGVTLDSLTVTQVAGTSTWDCADEVFAQSASGFSDAKNAHIYKSTGTIGTDLLVAYSTFSADKGNVDGDLTIGISDICDLT